MDTLSRKPKRKHKNGQSQYLFLVAGIIIGVLFAALGIVTYFAVNDAQTDVTYPQLIAATSTLVLPTEAPRGFNAQQIQPTVIASRIRSVAVSSDGNYLAAATYDAGYPSLFWQELFLTDNLLAQGEPQSIAVTNAGYYDTRLTFSSDNRLLMLSSRDNNSTVIYSTTAISADPVQTFPDKGVGAFSPTGEQLALAGNQGGIRLLDTTDYSLLDSLVTPDLVRMMAFSPTGEQLAVAANDHVIAGDQLRVFNTTDLTHPVLNYDIGGYVQDIAYHPSGQYIAVTHSDGLVVFDLVDNNRREYLPIAMDYVRAVTFSPEGDWLLVAGGNASGASGQIVMYRWDETSIIPPYDDYYEPIVLGQHDHVVNDLSFTPAGYLISASDDGSVRLWSIDEQREVSRLQL